MGLCVHVHVCVCVRICLFSYGVVLDLVVASQLGASNKFLQLLFLVLVEILIVLFPFNVFWHDSTLPLVLHILHKLLQAFVGQDVI